MAGLSLIEASDLPTAAKLEQREIRVKRFYGEPPPRTDPFKAKRALAGTYIPGDLVAAVDVALTLGRPLLLTGEPGSGKTLAAYWIANKLGLLDEQHFHEFPVKSDSRARDLCYDFDAVTWFRESQIKGEAVDKVKFITPRGLGKAFGWTTGDVDLPHVVLIDEIDKAPRDFPNDLLLELDEMRFKIVETDSTIGPPSRRPIIVITSNSERRLPDPFLRRCITHTIDIPPKVVFDILTSRMKAYRQNEATHSESALLLQGGAFWSGLSKISGLSRKPTIAEFSQWLCLAAQYYGANVAEIADTLGKGRGKALASLPHIATLFSNPDDLKRMTAD